MTAVFSPRVASLDDRYQRQDGTIYLTGIQALVRMLLDRARHDRSRGRADGHVRLRLRGLAPRRL